METSAVVGILHTHLVTQFLQNFIIQQDQIKLQKLRFIYVFIGKYLYKEYNEVLKINIEVSFIKPYFKSVMTLLIIVMIKSEINIT